jgi:hypothetical protein
MVVSLSSVFIECLYRVSSSMARFARRKGLCLYGVILIRKKRTYKKITSIYKTVTSSICFQTNPKIPNL